MHTDLDSSVDKCGGDFHANIATTNDRCLRFSVVGLLHLLQRSDKLEAITVISQVVCHTRPGRLKIGYLASLLVAC